MEFIIVALMNIWVWSIVLVFVLVVGSEIYAIFKPDEEKPIHRNKQYGNNDADAGADE